MGNSIPRIVIGDSGHNLRARGNRGLPVFVVRKTLPAPLGGIVRVAWRDECDTVEGGEYIVEADLPCPHGTQETWHEIAILCRRLPPGAITVINKSRTPAPTGKKENDRG